MQVDGMEHNNETQSCMEKGLLNDKNHKYLTLGTHEWLYWLNLLNSCNILICTTKESDSQHHSLCFAPAFCWFQLLHIGKGHQHLPFIPFDWVIVKYMYP